MFKSDPMKQIFFLINAVKKYVIIEYHFLLFESYLTHILEIEASLKKCLKLFFQTFK